MPPSFDLLFYPKTGVGFLNTEAQRFFCRVAMKNMELKRGDCKTHYKPFSAAASEMPPYPCTTVGRVRCRRFGNCLKRLQFLAFAAAVASAAAVSAVEVDGVAAKVGSETILRSEVAGEMMRRGIRDAAQYGAVREEMVERKLILKAAREAKMTMQEWIVENRVREIIQKAFGGDRNRLIETLGQQRVSYPEWYARMKEDMIVGAMRWNVVNKNVTASPAEMRAEFAAHPDRYASERLVTVSVILLKPEERVRREEVLSALKGGETFADLGAKRYEKVKPEDVFQAEVCGRIAKLAKGETSEWIDIDGWSFLIRKEDEVPGKKLTFEEAFDQVEANVKEAKSKASYEAWIERLREETYVKLFD